MMTLQHAFASVSTPARRPGALLQRRCACGGAPGPTGTCTACRHRDAARGPAFDPGLRVRGQLDAPAADGGPESEGFDEGPIETQDVEGLADAACPRTATLVGMGAGREKTNCRVPDGTHGVARLAQYTVVGHDGKSALTIDERFKKLEDPYGVFGALKPNQYTTEKSGRFDDCYSIATKDPLPPDFVLKVEQNHLLGSEVLSRVEITFRADSLRVCTYRRRPGSCEFGGRCRI